jgi:pyrroloquinoline quinone (PQQ) biosynthesis protein C
MGSRIPKEKEWIRRVLVEYIGEETGHDDWILSDIKNAGGNVEATKNSKPSLPVELMNAFNFDYITRKNPLGYFGMITVLEGASVALATQAVGALQKSLGLGKECFSYLESHSSLDIEHVQFIAKALNQITDLKDQADIIHTSKVIYYLFAEMFRALPHSSVKQAA